MNESQDTDEDDNQCSKRLQWISQRKMFMINGCKPKYINDRA